MTPAERDLRQALEESKRLEGLPTKKGSTVTPPIHSDNERRAIKLPRVGFDLTISLPWLLGCAAAVLWGLIGMYFQLRDVSKTLEQLTVDVRSNNATTIQLARDQAVLSFRVEKLEHERDHN
jgi:hypothetical protein